MNNNNQTCENNNNNNNTNYRSENQYSRGGAATSKNTTKNDYNSHNQNNKTLNRKISNPLPGLKTKQKPLINTNKEANENSEYVVFQNPNHNVLPDYHQVLKNNSTKNANPTKITSNYSKHKAEEDEENIFNLGKPQVKSYEKDNIGKTCGSDEEYLRNDDNDGIIL